MDKPLFKELVSAGAVRSVTLHGVPGGFVLTITTEGGSRPLCAQRGHPRVFKQLNSAAEFLLAIGVSRFAVETEGWSPTSLV